MGLKNTHLLCYQTLYSSSHSRKLLLGLVVSQLFVHTPLVTGVIRYPDGYVASASWLTIELTELTYLPIPFQNGPF